MITIEGKEFKIVGILQESGSFGGDDRKIIMPIEAARDTLEDMDEEEFDSITIKAENADEVEEIMTEAEQKLLISQHLT